MQHQPLTQLQKIAEISTGHDRPTMTRNERLERWAMLLEREPNLRSATLHQTEHQPANVLGTMRRPGSPISIAFADPILRDEGLKSDSYEAAKQFFEIADWQLHDIVCSCRYGAEVNARTSARYVRTAMAGPKLTLLIRIMRAIAR